MYVILEAKSAVVRGERHGRIPRVHSRV